MILNVECPILNIECLTLNIEYPVLNIECLILNIECLILNVECLILNTECLILNIEFWKCEGESIRWGYITDEHQNAITLSAMERWKKTVDLKEPSRKEDSLIIKSQRSLAQSLTILIPIIRIQVRLSKVLISWI